VRLTIEILPRAIRDCIFNTGGPVAANLLYAAFASHTHVAGGWLGAGKVKSLEDASQATTEVLTATVHNVASDAESPSTTNLVASMTSIIGSNNTAAAVQVSRVCEVDLDGLDPDKRYIQLSLTETNTYEGLISGVAILGGGRYLPESN
jgi:hypothetical protein